MLNETAIAKNAQNNYIYIIVIVYNSNSYQIAWYNKTIEYSFVILTTNSREVSFLKSLSKMSQIIHYGTTMQFQLKSKRMQ